MKVGSYYLDRDYKRAYNAILIVVVAECDSQGYCMCKIIRSDPVLKLPKGGVIGRSMNSYCMLEIAALHIDGIVIPIRL